MPQILKALQEEKKEKMKREGEIQDGVKDELLEQKQRIDERLKQVENRSLNEKIIGSLGKLKDVNDSLGDLQNALNLIWKRTQQIEEELNKVFQEINKF